MTAAASNELLGRTEFGAGAYARDIATTAPKQDLYDITLFSATRWCRWFMW